MADVQQVLEDFRSLRSEVTARLDAIDNVIEALREQVAAGQVDAAALDELAGEVQGARDAVASANPEDPSGDDATTEEPPADPDPV